MTKAYLLLFFDVRSGTPVFARAGIYGEDAHTLTTDLSGRECCVTAESAEGGTYGAAHGALVADLKNSPFYNRWIWPHLDMPRPARIGLSIDCPSCGEPRGHYCLPGCGR